MSIHFDTITALDTDRQTDGQNWQNNMSLYVLCMLTRDKKWTRAFTVKTFSQTEFIITVQQICSVVLDQFNVTGPMITAQWLCFTGLVNAFAYNWILSFVIDRLYHSFGIRDEVLSWIRSFVTGRTQRVRVGDQYSSSSAVYYGVPQGSVLGPILF